MNTIHALIMSFIIINCFPYNNDTLFMNKNIAAEIPSMCVLDTSRIINEIKKQYAEINATSTNYDKVEKEVFGESAEGAVLIGLYEKTLLKKIVGTYYGETGKTIEEYYFNGSDFFFVYSKRLNYEKPIYVESSGNVASIEENRYYFHKGSLVKWISGSNTILVGTKEFSKKNEFFKKDFDKHKEWFLNYKSN